MIAWTRSDHIMLFVLSGDMSPESKNCAKLVLRTYILYTGIQTQSLFGVWTVHSNEVHMGWLKMLECPVFDKNILSKLLWLLNKYPKLLNINNCTLCVY